MPNDHKRRINGLLSPIVEPRRGPPLLSPETAISQDGSPPREDTNALAVADREGVEGPELGIRPPRVRARKSWEHRLRHFVLRLLLVGRHGPPKEATRCQPSSISAERLLHALHQG